MGTMRVRKAKLCKGCGVEQPPDRFGKYPSGQYRATCDVCRARHENGPSRVPIGPFRDWCVGRIEVEQRRIEYDRYQTTTDHTSKGTPSPTRLVASMMGLTERRLFAILNGQKGVTLDLVDRALTTYDGATRLDDLYPYQEA